MMELEAQKAEITAQIEKERLIKPRLDKDHIAFWLYSFCKGDMNDYEYRRHIVDALVRAVYVYDTDDGKGRRIVLTYNVSGDNTSTVNGSDFARYAPPERKRIKGFLLF